MTHERGWRRLIRLAAQVRASPLLRGSGLFFLSTTIVNAGNYVFNLLLGRWLGPVQFADLSLIITLLLVMSFVAAGFQQTAARFSAAHFAHGDEAAISGLRRWLGRWAWALGIAVLVVLGAGAPVWQEFFHTASALPFALLAIGMPMYFAQSVDRGVLQGQTRFGALAISYQAEMWVRLVMAVVLVAVGWGLYGGVVAVTLSLVATWLAASAGTRGLAPPAWPARAERIDIGRFVVPVIVAELSLILINNSDVLLVKRYFPSEDAGLYAAVALIGRIVFFATFSVAVTLFPIVAQRRARGEPHRHLLWTGLGMVTGVSAAIVGACALWPESIIRVLFGDGYLGIAPLLWTYAVATALFSIGNVLINYHLSLGRGKGTVISLGAGIAQVAGIAIFHATLAQVITVQIVVMAGLLAALWVWDIGLRTLEARA